MTAPPSQPGGSYPRVGAVLVLMGFSVVLEVFSEWMSVDGHQCGLPAVRALLLEEKASENQWTEA